jgi:hypothetical protein
MVIDAILNVLSGAIAGLLGLMPHLAVPSWISSVGDALSTVTSALGATSAWLPWDILELGIVVSLAGVGLSVAVRGIRIAASFLTLGGGS